MTRDCYPGSFTEQLVIVYILCFLSLSGSGFQMETPILEMSQQLVIVEPLSTKDSPTVDVTIKCTCSLNVVDGGLEFHLTRKYTPPSEKSKVMLAEVNSNGLWIEKIVGNRPYVTIGPVQGKRGFTYTNNNVSCDDDGRYSCELRYTVANVYNVDSDFRNLTVTVKPGPLNTGGKEKLVLITKKPPDAEQLVCTGSVGTLGAGETVTWHWEFKNDTDKRWMAVEDSRRFRIHVSPLSKMDACRWDQTTTLTFDPDPSDGNRTYRCYPVQNSYPYNTIAQVYHVKFSTVKNTTLQTTTPTNTTDPFVVRKAKRNVTIKIIMYILLIVVISLFIILLIVVLVIRQGKRSAADREHGQIEKNAAADPASPSDSNIARKGSPGFLTSLTQDTSGTSEDTTAFSGSTLDLAASPLESRVDVRELSVVLEDLMQPNDTGTADDQN